MKRIEKFNARIQHDARSLQILGAGLVLGGFTLVFRDVGDGLVVAVGLGAIGVGFFLLSFSGIILKRLETRDD